MESHGNIYYITTGDGVWSVPVEGGKERKVLPEAVGAAWIPVHDGVVFAGRQKTLLAGQLMHWKAATGEMRKLGAVPHSELAEFTIDPTESSILYSVADHKVVDITVLENYLTRR
jgi:hypothetical protein